MTLSEVKRAISILAQYPQCVNWKELHDTNWEANPFRNLSAEAEAVALVLQAMPKHGVDHMLVRQSLSLFLKNCWNTYDWTSKSISRVLSSYPTFSEFWDDINKFLQNRTYINKTREQ